jgi:hypothetical protein
MALDDYRDKDGELSRKHGHGRIMGRVRILVCVSNAGMKRGKV